MIALNVAIWVLDIELTIKATLLEMFSIQLLIYFIKCQSRQIIHKNMFYSSSLTQLHCIINY